MAYRRTSLTAFSVAMLLFGPITVSSGNAIESCSIEQPLARCTELCKADDGMMAAFSEIAFDCHYDLRRSDWLATSRKMMPRMEQVERELHREPKEWLVARTSLRREFEQQNESGNAAAGVMVAFVGLWETAHLSGSERRTEILRVASALARASDFGSLTALHTLSAFFSAEDIWSRDLPSDVAACWRAANRTMIALKEHLATVSVDDPHLWAGRACIAPTLEALRN